MDSMKKAPALFLALTVSALSSQAFVDDEYPNVGIVYNTKEDSSITYHCTKEHSGLLECEFVQTSVRKKAEAKNLKKKLEHAKEQLPDIVKELSSDKGCDLVSVMLSVIEGKETAEQAAQNAPKGVIPDKQQFSRQMKEMSQSKKQESLTQFHALDEFCKTKSEESYLKITKLQHDKEMSTCTVSSNQFKQKFKWVEDYYGKGAWVVDAKPSGPCGVVQLDRFEAGRTDSKLLFWRYVAKKAITNPKGELLAPGFSCGDLDQGEYLYDWKSNRDNKLGCEYIEFSPL